MMDVLVGGDQQGIFRDSRLHMSHQFAHVIADGSRWHGITKTNSIQWLNTQIQVNSNNETRITATIVGRSRPTRLQQMVSGCS